MLRIAAVAAVAVAAASCTSAARPSADSRSSRQPSPANGSSVPALAPEIVRRIDQVVARALSHGGAGLSLAVDRDGVMVLAKGYGLADVAAGVPAGPATIYPIASVTKQFTAAAIMQLVGQGKLTLGETLPQALPAVHWRRE
jgi:CubicO group peptidase (beta-lactamase class C family)